MKISKARSGYDFLRERIKRNKALRNLTNDDIDIIIFNQLKSIAENRNWVKPVLPKI